MFEIKETKLKTSEILKQCREKFDVYCFYDDKQLDKDFPSPKKITERQFKKVVEADEELKNLSGDDLKEKGIECITLRERLLMELQYFNETGNHLDVENWTLCAGSRSSVGRVPSVYWNADSQKLCVYWSSPDGRHPCLRARAAVNPSTLNSLKLGSKSDSKLNPDQLDVAIELVKDAGYVVYKPV